MTKYFNPLFDSDGEENTHTQQSSLSTSDSVVSSSSAFNVDNSDVCPKCRSTTVPAKLLDEEIVMFCTNCRVALAIPE